MYVITMRAFICITAEMSVEVDLSYSVKTTAANALCWQIARHRTNHFGFQSGNHPKSWQFMEYFLKPHTQEMFSVYL
jgi:hypothetical protein